MATQKPMVLNAVPCPWHPFPGICEFVGGPCPDEPCYGQWTRAVRSDTPTYWGPEVGKVPSEKPSPIDGLFHSSVWGKLRDLEARVERLEYKAGLRED